jgi:glycosyltransferase involved in cell wall biosynthesis
MQSISIVLCTFNGDRFLDVQMRSLRRQDGVAEILAVDDGSTDGTLGILRRHAAEDDRIKVCVNASRLGVNRNFEHAVGLARSSWIALADQDDVWLPGKMARLRAAWDGEACLIHHATRKFCGAVPAAVPFPARERRKFFGSDLRRLLYRNTVVGHTLLVRAETVRRLRPFPTDVPYDWWIAVGAAAAGRIQYLDEYLVHYRIHDRNTYHPAGSRLARLRDEHGLRLNLLRALALGPELTEEQRDFVRSYREVLLRSGEGGFSWALWRFYRRHSTLLFGGVNAPPSWFTSLRKSSVAAGGVMLSNLRPGNVVRPVRPVVAAPTPVVDTFKRAG